MAEIDYEIENGCLGDGATKEDYLLSEGIADGLPDLYEQDDVRYEYNQGNQSWSKKSCTIFSPISALSDLWNYEFTLDEIKEVDELSYTKGRVANSGWYVQNAVKLAVERWNEKHPDKKSAFYKIDMDNDELIEKVISKKYNICTGYYGNVKWQNDYYADAILNGTDFGTATYGHAINVIKDSTKGRAVKDNYKGRTGKNKISTNVYGLEHNCSEIKPFHNCGYVITKVAEDNIEEIKRLNEITTLCNNLISDLGTLYNKVNDTNFQSILHYTADKIRKKISDCNEQLKKY